MVIKKRWRDRALLWRIGRIAVLVAVFYICFGLCIGFKRNDGFEIDGLKDGDLIIYEKMWRTYVSEDVVFIERDGAAITEYGAMNGGVVKGRVLAIIRIRNFIDE